MGLVNDHKVDLRPSAAGERLRAANLERLLMIRQGMVALHHPDAVDPLVTERHDGLINQVKRRHRERDALFLVEGALNDVGCRQRLAETGRRLKDRPPPSRQKRPAQLLEGARLMGPEGSEVAHGAAFASSASRASNAMRAALIALLACSRWVAIVSLSPRQAP